MISGLQQAPLIQPSVPSLINFWNAGFMACRTNMIYVVESSMEQGEFLEVARSQVPLIDLVLSEFNKFKQKGWNAIPGITGRKLSAMDEKHLSLFKHDVLNSEGFFVSLVEAAETDATTLYDWYESAQHVYRRRPALGPMIRGVCYSLLPQSTEYQVRLMPGVDSNRYLRDECFKSARIAFINLISNGIKFNRPGGRVIIKNEGFKLSFSDTGIGMHPHFAAALVDTTRPHREEERVGHIPGSGSGWQTIRQIAHELGWWIIPYSVIDKGTTVEIYMNEGNFYRPDKVITTTFEIFDGSMLISAADVVEGAKVFSNMEPFQGYRFTNEGMLDISESPIYLATKHASDLLNRLYKARENHDRKETLPPL
jgi:hypothetical protein